MNWEMRVRDVGCGRAAELLRAAVKKERRGCMILYWMVVVVRRWSALGDGARLKLPRLGGWLGVWWIKVG
jgi:hypothetical protein